MLVLAGPGSGKTTVIVNRILYLIKECQIPPDNILVVTFTKDAALSMQKRFMEESPPQAAVHFGTFHSVFYHILRNSRTGRSAPTLFTRPQKKKILITILKERTLAREKYYDMDAIQEDAEEVLNAIGFYKNTRDEIAALKKLPEAWKVDFQSIFEEFRKCMHKQGGLDFDDMVYECRELLLQDKERLRYWQERFPYILVDEFQDINPLQYEVIKLLGAEHRNLFVVGDDDQAIYGFRGAAPACIRQFVEDFKARQVILNANYRSSGEIVAVSGKVIAENKDRYAKKCYAAGKCAQVTDSVKIKVFQERTEEFAWLTEELKVFERVKALQGETCGVLFRTNTQMQRLASVLKRESVPYAMKGQPQSPYEHFIAKDIMAYLHLAKGEMCREYFLRVMNRPLRYLDREAVGEMNSVDLEKLRINYARRNRPGDSAVMQEIDLLSQQLAALNHMSPGPAVIYICKAVKYETYLYKKARSKEQLEEWLELLDFLKQEAGEYGNWEEWMRFQRQTFEGQSRIQNQAIHLMTVHASKGLEFDRVIIPDCNEKTFPYGSMPDKETVEEERRVFYVGMTRAKKCLELLCITGSKERPRVMSRFLNPIVEDYLPEPG